MEPRILFEDTEIVVVDKPASLRVHAVALDDTSDTLAGWLVRHAPEAAIVGEDPLRPGIVHRLDQDTSGVMVLAKTQRAYEKLKMQFFTRTVSKVYHALVVGVVRADRGQIDRALQSDAALGRQKTTPLGGDAARAALTYWKVSERFPASGVSELEVYPKTGRTHQIRVHMRSIGHPLVCDSVYGRGQASTCPLGGLSRQALHAYSLEIELPRSRERRIFIAPEPADFESARAALRAAEGS